MIKNCLICSQEYRTKPSHEKRRKYCSYKCGGIGRQGKASWNKGLHPEYVTGENNYQWKGENVSYSGLHHWVIKRLGHPFWCTWCFSMVKVEWANISHEYKRDTSDWLQLCHKCHMQYDRNGFWGAGAKLFKKSDDKTHYTERL